MASRIYNFQKEERLCSKKLLEALFKSGSSFLLYPFRITWQQSPDVDQKFSAQVVVAVPKKRFKHSVDRNQIRRRIKEAYRLNKGCSLYPFLLKNNFKIALAINYVGKEIHDYQFIEKKLLLVFVELSKKIGYDQVT